MWVFTGFQVRLVKTRNIFGVELPGQIHNLSLVPEVLEHSYILAIEGNSMRRLILVK
jgi:hypothetical protein